MIDWKRVDERHLTRIVNRVRRKISKNCWLNRSPSIRGVSIGSQIAGRKSIIIATLKINSNQQLNQNFAISIVKHHSIISP